MKELLPILCITLFCTMFCTTCSPQRGAAPSDDSEWWKNAVIYQIYPRSFKDSDGDGIGDLKGIINKANYLHSLGINAVWLNPIYSSPNADNGYDVSDYRNIGSEYGSMADFDRMLNALHQLGIRVIMDIVVNHSSDQHPWFLQARSARDNPHRQYYHWWPAEKGKPPYRYSLFDEKGDAWTYDSLTNSYYLHYFSAQQPDLNWENPKLRQEVYDIMKFWAEKGVDGFRLDAFQFAAKDTTFPELPKGYEKNFSRYYAMQGNLHAYLREMHEQVLKPYKVMSVAEGAGNSFEDAHNLVDEARGELDMAYAFEGVDIAKASGYSLLHFKRVFSRWDSAFAQQGWLSVFLSNHDQARLVSRFGNDQPAFREASAKLLNTFILSMRGTPYCYYGDELGMTNIGFERIAQYRDIAALNGYKKVLHKGGDTAAYLRELKFSSRDNGRTPMQWDNTLHAGFSSAAPWLPVNPNYPELNAEMQSKDVNSVLSHFRQMVQLRRLNPVLVHGAYRLLAAEHAHVYAYTRSLDSTRVLVLLNFSDEIQEIRLPELEVAGKVLINNYLSSSISGQQATLKPWQAMILSLRNP